MLISVITKFFPIFYFNHLLHPHLRSFAVYEHSIFNADLNDQTAVAKIKYVAFSGIFHTDYLY